MTYPSEFPSFLLAAKRATYAGLDDDATIAPLLPDSKQLEYAKDDFLYRDIYAGILRFVGQEIVYRRGRALWSMSYSGGLLPDVSRSEAAGVYKFVRAALTACPEDQPIRGPKLFNADGMSYSRSIHGDLHRFHGTEYISRDKGLYELHFAGGWLA